MGIAARRSMLTRGGSIKVVGLDGSGAAGFQPGLNYMYVLKNGDARATAASSFSTVYIKGVGSGSGYIIIGYWPTSTVFQTRWTSGSLVLTSNTTITVPNTAAVQSGDDIGFLMTSGNLAIYGPSPYSGGAAVWTSLTQFASPPVNTSTTSMVNNNSGAALIAGYT